LEHGKPITSASQGVVSDERGILSVKPLAEIDPDKIVIHDAHIQDPTYAFALSRLSGSSLDHVPVGVFRDVERAPFSELIHQQIADVVAREGKGELGALLNGGDTWQVE
jgi:2-oxoglutarate ferredoxin oxidoreductase subunit beta